MQEEKKKRYNTRDTPHALLDLLSSMTSLPSPSARTCRDYHHPYDPYDIQLQFMDALYETLQNGYKIGMFESPTGTGKTLSIICSSMTWLRDYKRNYNLNTKLLEGNVSNNDDKQAGEDHEGTKGKDDDEDDDDEPEWVKMAYQKSIVDKSKNKLKDFERHLNEVDQAYKRRIQKNKEANLGTKIRNVARKQQTQEDPEESFLPNDYNETNQESFINDVESRNLQLSTEIERLMKSSIINNNGSGSNAVDDAAAAAATDDECPTKIFFTSRTHSQLNQFSSQLRLTKFDASFKDLEERTKYLPLGSRKQLCINDKVKNRKGEQSINDACIDLQKTKKGCTYLPNPSNSSTISSATKEFADLSLAQIRDIEDLGDLGSSLHTCPYYSVREGIKLAEVISLPYQLLLQSGSRDALKLDIKNSIIIIDEAHNIFDTLTSLYSVKITAAQLSRTIKALKIYMTKFLKKLNSGNRINLMKLTKLCKLLMDFLQSDLAKSAKLGDQVVGEEIFQGSTGDLVNIHKMEAYLNKSKIAFKLQSYMEKIGVEDVGIDFKLNSSSPILFDIVKFLKCLSYPKKEGKFFWDRIYGDNGGCEVSLNYMLLDPSAVFKEIVDQAKCVILCGGTMEPTSDFTDYLFPSIKHNKIKKFACGHIIPKNNLKVIPVGQYYGNFDFLYNRRNDQNQIKRLGEFLIKICEIVPAGIVVFISSYQLLSDIVKIWRETSIYSRLNLLKQVFEESVENTKLTSLLSEYSHVINTQCKGAILLAVVGGKMSEGINFSDNLARAVIMVGMPYPNAFSGEIVAKRNFIEEQVITKGGTIQQARAKSYEYYDNLCMKAVNQSIGRSIRHAKDYAIIILLDYRYQTPKVQGKLSKWVRDRIANNTKANTFDPFLETKKFFSFPVRSTK